MRESHKWSQEELAVLVGMPQTAISRLESPDYGKATITTLKRMARVYDVGLDVRFVSFSHLVDRMSKTPRLDMGLTSDSVDVPSFEEEERDGAFRADVATASPVLGPVNTMGGGAQINVISIEEPATFALQISNTVSQMISPAVASVRVFVNAQPVVDSRQQPNLDLWSDMVYQNVPMAHSHSA